MRVLIDTNVIISAIFWAGTPKKVLNAVRRKEFEWVISETLITELQEVLTDTSKPFRLTQEEAKKAMNFIQGLAIVIPPKSNVSVCRDENDNQVLECALDGQADFIVTGDKDLLSLGKFEKIEIMDASNFLRNVLRIP